MSTPTPRPWTLSRSGTAVDLPNGSQVRIVRLGPEQSDMADARFIIKAVNAHDELVAALKLATECTALHTGNGANFKGTDYARFTLPNGDVDLEAVVRHLRAVLAKLGAK